MDLMKEQERLEEESFSIARRKIEQSAAEYTPAMQSLFKVAIKPVVDALKEFHTKTVGKRVDLKDSLDTLLEEVSYAEIASISISAIISGLSKNSFKLTGLSIAVGTHIKYQFLYKKVINNKDTFGAIVDKELQRKTNPRQYLRARPEFNTVKSMETTLFTRLGSLMIDLVASSTGLITIEYVNRHGYSVAITPKCEDWLLGINNRVPELHPSYLPMVVPPALYVNGRGGGYLFRPNDNMPVIKYRGEMTAIATEETDWSLIDDVINKIQRTAYKVDTRILEAIHYIFNDRGGDMAGLPPFKREDFPFKEIEWKDLTHEQKVLKSGYATAEKIKSAKRLALQLTLNMANRMKDYERIYYPHELDSRGRIYPQASFLTPQGQGYQKALLSFADAVALGPNGFRAIKIEGANLYGVDKVSLDDRVKWVEANHDSILMTCDNWRLNGWWMEADEPFGFLKFCFEYRDIITQISKGIPVESIESTFDVHVDGSCNGIQNFAALLLDKDIANKVNIVKKDKPSDIYQEVADAVNILISEKMFIPEEDKFARFWSGKVDRSTVKRAVMTTPYGVTLRGIKDQLISMFREERHIISPTDSFEDGMTYVSTIHRLGDWISEAITTQVSAPYKVMTWLKKIIDTNPTDMITWRTPAGFLAHHTYYDKGIVKIRTYLGNKAVQLKLREDTKKPNKRKQKTSISPNYIHSMDASHLMITVAYCSDNDNMDAFWMIHDSYGCHAGNVDKLNKNLRKAFYDIYSPDGDLYQDWLEVLRQQYNVEEPPPAKGELDLKEVFDAEYFFS